MTSAPPTLKGRATKEAIFGAARSVFAADGYAGARVSDIAAEAGLSNGAFYRYYSNKREVLVDLLSTTLEGVFQESWAAWRPRDPFEALQVSVERYLRFYEANADVFKVLHEAVELDREMEALQAAGRVRLQERTVRMLRRGQGEGLVRRSLDPQLYAAFLSGVVEHYAYVRFVLQRYPDRPVDEVAREMTAFWAHGVSPVEQSARSEAPPLSLVADEAEGAQHRQTHDQQGRSNGQAR